MMTRGTKRPAPAGGGTVITRARRASPEEGGEAVPEEDARAMEGVWGGMAGI